ncbi:nucleoside deaminase [Streptomyces longispororuber]|uniref:nucleoside deaminase n=1 Tax=Streptomyces longispororuber TaxID=68230 RepID=UPI0036F749C8
MTPVFFTRRRLLSMAPGAVAVPSAAGSTPPHEHPDGQWWAGQWPAELRSAAVRAMPAAVAYARSGRWPFGAVLVAAESGEVVAGAANTVRDEDPTAHAEMNALRSATARGRPMSHHVVVSTAEPCPMCAGALLWAGVRAVVFGTSSARIAALGIPQLALPFETVARHSTLGPLPAVGGGVRTDLTDPLYQAMARRRRGGRAE